MPRKSKLHKEDEQEIISINLDTLENQSLDELTFPKEPDPTLKHFVLSPNLDYDSISNQIAKIEEMSKAHPMSSTTPVTPHPPAPPIIGKEKILTAPPVLSAPSFAVPQNPLHTPVGPDITGFITHTPMTIAPPQYPNRNLISPKEEEQKRKEEEENLPPINDDFLSFLMHKQPLSFGWVVDNSFLSNFGIHPDCFKADDKFIFWVTPAVLNIFKVDPAVGFQRPAPKSQQKLHPHIFLIKILENTAGDPNDPYYDTYGTVINDPNYNMLREALTKRGIDFIYHDSANHIWQSILKGRFNL